MDEALEAVELAADLGLDGAVNWLLRIAGILAIVTGLALWLGLGWDLLVVPAILLAVGVVLVVVPSVFEFLLELL
jgi:hypothetical protein